MSNTPNPDIDPGLSGDLPGADKKQCISIKPGQQVAVSNDPGQGAADSNACWISPSISLNGSTNPDFIERFKQSHQSEKVNPPDKARFDGVNIVDAYIDRKESCSLPPETKEIYVKFYISPASVAPSPSGSNTEQLNKDGPFKFDLSKLPEGEGRWLSDVLDDPATQLRWKPSEEDIEQQQKCIIVRSIVRTESGSDDAVVAKG